MKKLLKYTYVAVLAAMLLTSCGDFLDVNTDPTRLKSASLTQALVAAETETGFYAGADAFLYSSIFSQQAAGSGVLNSQTRLYDQYILTNTDVNNAFSNYYAGALADLNYIRQNAFTQNNPQHAGIAKILQAYNFSQLTDLWGSVPYTDALKGTANVQPKYDDSQTIYDSLFVLIDAGIANLAQTNFLPIASEDLIYGGDIAKWNRFANTLKLRLALHYAKVDNGAKLKAIISQVESIADVNMQFMKANADNFQLTFENVVNRQNPIQQFELQRADYYAPNAVMVSMMNTKADPRRSAYFTPYPYNSSPAVYVGTVSGSTATTPLSRIHTYLRGAIVSDNGARTAGGAPTNSAITYTGAAPIRMVTFAEYNFIRAEAAAVYGASGDAATFLKAGIDASIADAGVTGGTYSTTHSADISLQNIIEEKFVALYGVAVEPWTDWRRTGFPVLTPSPAAVAQGNLNMPRILVYPLSEQQTNVANVPTDRVSMEVKGVFWDK